MNKQILPIMSVLWPQHIVGETTESILYMITKKWGNWTEILFEVPKSKCKNMILLLRLPDIFHNFIWKADTDFTQWENIFIRKAWQA